MATFLEYVIGKDVILKRGGSGGGGGMRES